MQKGYFDIPVLLIIFRRRNTALQVINAISNVRPRKLYISQDGPRNEDERKEVLETREVVLSRINWKCDLKLKFQDKNLGLRHSMIDSISWLFEKETTGIILEDDCIPGKSFFAFCKLMLSKYKDDVDIMHISGSSFIPANLIDRNGYYFSKYSQVWGWATWRRAWEKMETDITALDKLIKSKWFLLRFPSLWERLYWNVLFDAVSKGKINSWAYLWQYSIWKNRAKSISPAANLVRNIGLKGGSHINTNLRIFNCEIFSMGKRLSLLGKDFSSLADEYALRNVYRISPLMVFLQRFYYLFR